MADGQIHFEQVVVTENTDDVVIDLDCGESENPDAGLDICMLTHKENNEFGEDTEKPTSYVLSLGELSDMLVTSATGDDLDKVNSKVHPDEFYSADIDDYKDDGSYYIIVSDESDGIKAADSADNFFAGVVDSGDSFEAAGSFGSETFVHIYSADGSTLLQTINFHTSCSSPLIIGDQYGSITLEGATLEGKDSGTFHTVGQTEADGDTGVFYEITQNEFDSNGDPVFQVDSATGEVTFVSPPDFENPFGDNPDNKYDIVVTAWFTDDMGNPLRDQEPCDVKPLEICVEDDCIKILENTDPIIADLDCGDAPENPDLGTCLCEASSTEGKPTLLTLTYAFDTGFDQVTDQDDGKRSETTAGTDDDGEVFIRVLDGGGSLIQSFTVTEGESFDVDNGGKFDSSTFVEIYDSEGGDLLQSIEFHTSCSQPLVIGDRFASITVQGAVLESGAKCGLNAEEANASVEGIEYVINPEFKDGALGLFEVNEKGEVSFVNPPDFENPKDSDGDGQYEIRVDCLKDGVIIASKYIDVCVEDGECINVPSGQTDTSQNLNLTVDCPDDTGLDLCAKIDEIEATGVDLYNKPVELKLTLGEKLGTVDDVTNDQDGKVEVGDILGEDDGTYFVRVSNKSNPDDTNENYFAGNVAAGGTFTALASAAGKNEFGSDTYVHIFDDDSGEFLQTIKFHTSCSKPLILGDQFASFTVDGATLEDKDTGETYSFATGPGPVEDDDMGSLLYEISSDAPDGTFSIVEKTGEVTFNAPAYDPDGLNEYKATVRAYVDENGNGIVDEDEEDCFEEVEICYDVTPPVLGSISGRYFKDAGDPPDPDKDCDGQDNDFTGTDTTTTAVVGARVFLLQGNVVIAETTTDANGEYSFTGLEADNYQVRFAPTDGAKFTDKDQGGDDTIDSDVNPATGETGTIELRAGENVTDVDAGICLGSLSGRYFCDTNDNDVDDGQDTDPGVAGVLVTLLDNNLDPVLDENNEAVTTTTDGEGRYSFGQLPAGTYGVQFTDPDGVLDGKQLVTPNVEDQTTPEGTGDEIDSDAIGDTTLSTIENIEVVAGENTPNNDAGAEYIPPEPQPDTLKLCADQVWSINLLDNDGDPLTVTELRYTGADGLFDTDDDQVILPGSGQTKIIATGAFVTIDAFGNFTYDVTGDDIFDGGDVPINDPNKSVVGLGEEVVEKFKYTVVDGNGATATSNVDVTVCGTASIETVADLLAGATVSFEVDIVFEPEDPLNPDDPDFRDAFTLTLTETSNDNIPLDTYDLAYCMDGFQGIDPGVPTTANVLVLTPENAALVDTAENPINVNNIDAVNWLLNNDYTQVDDLEGVDGKYTDLEVQEAIWTLLNGDVFYINKVPLPQFQDDGDGARDVNDEGVLESATLENVDDIVQAALDNGEGFVPGDGDVFGLILDPTDPEGQDQPFIIGVEYECLC